MVQLLAVVKLGANGMRFTLEDTNQFQANALLTKDMFRCYELRAGEHDEPVFGVPFDTLLDVLNVFGTAAATQRGTGLVGFVVVANLLLAVLTQGQNNSASPIRPTAASTCCWF